MLEQDDLKLVDYAVRRLSRNGHLNYSDRDDLYSDGMLGLAQGVKQWDESAEVRYRFNNRTYYVRKIVERAIIDGMRTRNGRDTTGFRKQEFEKRFVRLDWHSDEMAESTLERYVGIEDEHLFVAADLLERLPERERLILWRHDILGDRLHEIADDLGVTESRVSQIRAVALDRLRGDRPMEEAPAREAAPPAPTVDYRLTDREIQVLAEVADGHNNRTIAERLLLSEETIKSHLRHVASKMQATNRAHAVALAFRAGLVA